MHKPFRFGVIARGARSGPLWGENVRQAEELGYATWLVSDHPGRGLAPLTSLALAAAASTSLRPGSFVFCNDWRHPVLLAQEVATLDQLSGGRFELGLGAGHALNEYRQLGLPVDSAGTRIRRLEEAVRLIKQCLTPEPVSFSGTFYTVAGLEHRLQPLQRPHPPIFLGGGGKQMLRLSAREADIIGIAPKFGAQGVEASDLTSEATERKIAWIREAAGERLEHLELSCTLFEVVIGTDHQPAAGSRQAPRLGMPLPPDSIHAAIGSVDQVVEELLARRARYGISYLQVFESEMETFASVVARLAGK